MSSIASYKYLTSSPAVWHTGIKLIGLAPDDFNLIPVYIKVLCNDSIGVFLRKSFCRFHRRLFKTIRICPWSPFNNDHRGIWLTGKSTAFPKVFHHFVSWIIRSITIQSRL